MRRPLLVLTLAIALVAACGGSGAPKDAAAVVNGDAVTAARYDLLVSSAQRRVETNGPAVDWTSGPGRARLREIQAQALRLAIRNTVIKQLAVRAGVRVGDQDLDAALAKLEGVTGGADQLDQELQMEGLTRAQYRALLRDTLLDRELRSADPKYDEHLAAALRRASVQAYVGPCAADHQYPRCVDGSR